MCQQGGWEIIDLGLYGHVPALLALCLSYVLEMGITSFFVSLHTQNFEM